MSLHVERRRNRERPKKGWMDCMKDDIMFVKGVDHTLTAKTITKLDGMKSGKEDALINFVISESCIFFSFQY